MIHISEIVRTPSPRWVVNISNDPISGLKRKVKAWGLSLNAEEVSLKCLIHWCDADYNELVGARYTPYIVTLVAGISESGTFINPNTGERVFPTSDGWLPDGTIFRYDAIMSMCGIQSIVDDNVIGFINSADLAQEFDI